MLSFREAKTGSKSASFRLDSLDAALPAVREEASISVSRAITAWGGTGWTLCLEGLPVEGSAIQETLLLSAGCQRTPIGATVSGVLPTDVAQAVAARHWASAGSRGKEGNERKTRRELCSRRGGEVLKPGSKERNFKK